jgi:hypothetical protein
MKPATRTFQKKGLADHSPLQKPPLVIDPLIANQQRPTHTLASSLQKREKLEALSYPSIHSSITKQYSSPATRCLRRPRFVVADPVLSLVFSRSAAQGRVGHGHFG